MGASPIQRSSLLVHPAAVVVAIHPRAAQVAQPAQAGRCGCQQRPLVPQNLHVAAASSARSALSHVVCGALHAQAALLAVAERARDMRWALSGITGTQMAAVAAD